VGGSLEGGALLPGEAQRRGQQRDGVSARAAAHATLQVGDAAPGEPRPRGQLRLRQSGSLAGATQAVAKGCGRFRQV
jgi:hypothetical protein